jgi:signal transduction histidine kinase
MAHDLLMVAREAAYNSMLHGRPAQVDVTLTYNDGGLVLNLDDDGCGFDPQQADQGNGHHFGLKGMKERVERSGGKFHLASAPGKGVRIEVRVPRRG